MSSNAIWAKHFDDFFFSTRVLPAVTMMFPVLVLAVCKGLVNNQWQEASTTFALAIVFITFSAYIVREWGKTYEEKMYDKLGGMPTTIIMRFSDDRIDTVSKQKYHKWFNMHDENYQLPMTLEEELVDALSDSKYNNAMKYLRVRANADRGKYFRVYQELKKYNYWRSLYGGKKMAITVYVFLILREIYLMDKFAIIEIIENPIPKYSVFCGVLLWMVLYCAVVTKKTVERNAFDYAMTIAESIHN